MMTNKEPVPLSGEERTRRRRRNQYIYFGVAMVIGGLLGWLISSNDSGTGNLFFGDYADLKLDPTIALVLAGGFLFALVVLPLWGFTQIDELQREQNLIGFTGGCVAVLGCFPMWTMLYAGGHAPPPDAFGLFAVGFAAMGGSFLYAKFRT
jgi:drug/metabolite transporter (DMT)-like permease